MKLVIKRNKHAPTRDFVLCDEQGNRIPLQKALSIKTEVGEHTEATVTFLVDGDQIRIDGDVG